MRAPWSVASLPFSCPLGHVPPLATLQVAPIRPGVRLRARCHWVCARRLESPLHLHARLPVRLRQQKLAVVEVLEVVPVPVLAPVLPLHLLLLLLLPRLLRLWLRLRLQLLHRRSARLLVRSPARQYA